LSTRACPCSWGSGSITDLRRAESGRRAALDRAASVAGAGCALTTAVGFGSLVITDFAAIHSMGIVAVIGVSAMAAASLTLLPAIAALSVRKK
jgi:predicted RND superfamily exporter protein